jgi:hypothetical protein
MLAGVFPSPPQVESGTFLQRRTIIGWMIGAAQTRLA